MSKLNYTDYSNNDYRNITPKISIISTIFNKSRYLNRLIKSVKKQMMEEFELILIDDFSEDDSVEIIKKIKRYDNRIKLIKNKKNKGTFFSRITGALLSKGEYIIWVDPDDIILQKGLYNAYNHIKKYDLSIVQFNSLIQINDKISIKYQENLFPDIVNQPFLLHYGIN